MSDAKISALPASTTPLSGTEVLPIVQSGVTKKVANNDLRPKQIQSNATSGVLQVVGPAAASTRVMTTPDADFTAARIDAAQSFTGDQTLSTGNLVIGTAGKGIDFSADGQAAGMTSELLDDYEEGTWTPDVRFGGANTGVTYYNRGGRYIKVGNMVMATGSFYLNSLGSATGSMDIYGLPFTVINAFPGGYGSFPMWLENVTYTGTIIGGTNVAEARISLGQATEAGSTSLLTQANFNHGSRIYFTVTYPTA